MVMAEITGFMEEVVEAIMELMEEVVEEVVEEKDDPAQGETAAHAPQDRRGQTTALTAGT